MVRILATLVTRNIYVKIVALLIAYGLWYVVTTEEQLFQDMYVPILYQQLSENATISGEKTELVKVRFQAPESALRKLRENGIDIQLDLSNTKLGAQFIRLLPEQLRVPYGVAVTQFFPPSITLNIERKVEKEVPVEPQVEGEPAAGYEVKQVRAVPSTIRIAGAESDVRQVESAMTETVNVSEKTTTVNEQVALQLGNPNVQFLDRSVAAVVVTIGDVIRTREFANVPVVPLSCDRRARLTPTSLTLTVQGPELALEALTLEDLTASVDLRDCPAGKTLRDLRVTVQIQEVPQREKLKVLLLEPATVSARISAR